MNKNKLSWWEIVKEFVRFVCFVAGVYFLTKWLVIGSFLMTEHLYDWVQKPSSLEQRVERLEEWINACDKARKAEKLKHIVIVCPGEYAR